MKGSPEAPSCGFSRKICGLLQDQKIDFSHFDILTDESVRQGEPVLIPPLLAFEELNLSRVDRSQEAKRLAYVPATYRQGRTCWRFRHRQRDGG